jgi:uncharacterized spore protein YtfJ
MKVDELVSSAREALTVRRVYGEPYEKDGVTFIPAARFSGGGGGGTGTDDEGAGGEGGGFGLSARPAGAYVIVNGEVRWRPAIDVNRLAAALSAVVVVLLLTRLRRASLKSRERRRAMRKSSE